MPQAKPKSITSVRKPRAYVLLAVNSMAARFRAPANDTSPKKTIVQVIAEAVDKLPPHTEVPKAPRSPYVTHYGKVLDPVAHAHWVMAKRSGGAQ